MDDEGWQRLLTMARGRGPFAYRALELMAGYAFGKPTQVLGTDAAMPLQFSLRIDRGIDDLDALPEPTPNGHVLP